MRTNMTPKHYLAFSK